MTRPVNICKEARGRNCQVRVPGICNHNPETTVLAHYRLSDSCGTGIKPPDTQGAYACNACHDAIDGRIKTEFTRVELRLYHAEGVFRTQQILLDEENYDLSINYRKSRRKRFAFTHHGKCLATG